MNESGSRGVHEDDDSIEDDNAYLLHDCQGA